MLDIDEYEKMTASLKLLSELADGEHTGKEQGWLSIDHLEKSLEV